MKRINWGGWMKSAVVVAVLMCTVGCEFFGGPLHPDPVRPRGIAPLTFGSLAWSAAGDSVGFFHVPIVSIWYDPRSGDTGYELAESLAGWWAVPASGGLPTRYLGTVIRDADVHFGTSRMACLVDAGWPSGYSNFVFSLAGITPVLDSGTNLGFLGYAPRWSGSGDSLLLTVYEHRLIAAADGTGYHEAARGQGTPSWDPTGHAIVVCATATGVYPGYASRILRLNLDTGDTLTLLVSTTHDLRHVRYSPNGAKLAYIAQSLSDRTISLWVVDRNGDSPRKLSDMRISEEFAWAPDGRRIAVVRYASKDFGPLNSQVWVIDAVSGAASQLTTGH